MKLLFDQNISFRIMRLLPDDFFHSRHVTPWGLTTTKMWKYGSLPKKRILPL
nr:hypothetical protein [Proteiniphilum acetatigenes]